MEKRFILVLWYDGGARQQVVEEAYGHDMINKSKRCMVFLPSKGSIIAPACYLYSLVRAPRVEFEISSCCANFSHLHSLPILYLGRYLLALLLLPVVGPRHRTT